MEERQGIDRYCASPSPLGITLSDMIKSRIEEIYLSVQSRQELSLGYPLNQKFDYSPFAPFLNLHLNNLGDPYSARSMLLHTHDLEQEVLDYFAKLWNAPPRSPFTTDSFWGYVLGMGATEGNMYALWSAREYFRTGPGKSKQQPLVYFSEETHYSVEKAAKITGMATFQETGNRYYPGQCPLTSDGHWPYAVPVDKYGAINPEMLSALVGFFSVRGYPSVIVLNLGSTFQGAFDDPQAVWQSLSRIPKPEGCCLAADEPCRQDCWIHIDGAIGAAYLPYLEMAFNKALIREKGPCFDFRLPWVNSVVMSSHKWYGAPVAAGIYMSKEKYRMQPATQPEYIDSPDTTFGGSRNGLSTLLLWYAISVSALSKQAETAAECMKLAMYACEQLATVKASHPAFHVEKGPQSLTVLFTRPNNRIFNKFQLSGRAKLAHIVVMPHVTRSAIDRLVRSLHGMDAFD